MNRSAVAADGFGGAAWTIEPELSRVRFLATVRYADALVQRIYPEGGLAWCSRHDVVEHPGPCSSESLGRP